MKKKAFITIYMTLFLFSMFTFVSSQGMIVELTIESNGGLAVNIQDQHSRALDIPFIKANAPPTTLSADATENEYIITVTSTVGFVDDSVILVASKDNFYIGRQLGAPTGNDITLDTPLDFNYTTGSIVFAANYHMNVDGSVTPQIFQIGPLGTGSGLELDITRVMGYFQDNIVMDDAKFGGLPALTNGVTLRRNDGTMTNLWNAKSNGEIALMTFDFAYTEKAPAGSYGARFRNTYAGPSKHGVTIRLEAGDTLEIIIHDDLTNLEDFIMMAQGHVVTN